MVGHRLSERAQPSATSGIHFKQVRFPYADQGGYHLLGASASWAVIPLAIALGGGGGQPFVFAAAWCFGGFAGTTAFCSLRGCGNLVGYAKSMSVHPDGFWSPISEDNHRWNWQMWLATARIGAAYLIAAWAAAYLSEVVVAVILEAWPVFFLLVLHLLFRNTPQAVFRTDWRTFLLFLLVFAGVAVVIVSQRPDGDFGGVGYMDFLAAALLLASSVLYSAGDGLNVKWSAVMLGSFRNGPEASADRFSSASNEVTSMQFARLPAFAFGVIAGTVGAVLSGETWRTGDVWLIVALSATAGVFASVVSTVGTFRCHQRSGLLCLRYLTPVFAIGYLWVFTDRENTVNWVLLTAGLVAVAAGSALVTFRRQH